MKWPSHEHWPMRYKCRGKPQRVWPAAVARWLSTSAHRIVVGTGCLGLHAELLPHPAVRELGMTGEGGETGLQRVHQQVK